jgi:hypothetical protein
VGSFELQPSVQFFPWRLRDGVPVGQTFLALQRSQFPLDAVDPGDALQRFDGNGASLQTSKVTARRPRAWAGRWLTSGSPL